MSNKTIATRTRVNTKGRGVARFFLSLIVVTLVAGVVANGAAAQRVHPAPLTQQPGGNSETRVVEQDERHIVLEIVVPDYVLTQETVNGKLYDVISIPDWGLTSQPGSPQVPTRRVMLGIPLDAEIQLEVVNSTVNEAGPTTLIPAPEVFLQGDPLDQLGPWTTPPTLEKRFVESGEVYGRDAFYPGKVARLGETGFIRNQRVVAVELYPIQYNPALRRLQIHSRLQIELSFSYPAGRSVLQPAAAESPAFEQILKQQVVNYSSAITWRGKPTRVSAASGWPLSSDAWKMVVKQDGIYRLAHDDLVAAGVPVDTHDPRTIQIFSNGQEIAIRVVGEADGQFDAEDSVLFYGQGINNKYADQNVYWLTFGSGQGRRMPERDGAPSGSVPSPVVFTAHKRIEQDLLYSSQWPGDDSTDRWYWQLSKAPTDVIVTVDLGNVSTEVMSGTLWVSMKGLTAASVNPDHHAKFYVNDHYVGEHYWDGSAVVQYVRLDFPQSWLIGGTNTIKTNFPGDTGATVDYTLFDRLELSYGHAYQADSNQLAFAQTAAGTWKHQITGFTQPDVEVYDISAPVTVTQITNPDVQPATAPYTARFVDTVPSTTTYLALTSDRWLLPVSITVDTPSDLHDTSNGADYIIISHANFLPAAQALANYRTTQGLRTKVVDLQDVYDEFGYGLSTANAIQGFVRYAFEHWQPPAPTYVVLLGDGTYDPKNHLNSGVVNYLSPYLAFIDPWGLGETSADNRYACVGGQDLWPDLFIGRLPANSLAEANEMVDKIMAYEQTMQGADWNSHLTFVAGRQPDPKNAGNFHDLSDDVAAHYVPPLYSMADVYLGSIAGSTCGSGAACKQQLINEINGGTLLVNYIGHGATNLWDAESIFDLSAINLLTNADRYPIMLPFTCLEGYFIMPNPTVPSISESVVRAADKGAVASWGPAGLGVTQGHDQLNKGFFQALFFDGVRELGPATYAGKLRLYATGSNLDQIDTYHLFGDPALHINRLDYADLQVQKTAAALPPVSPSDVLTYTLTFTNAGPDIATQVVLTDLMPALLVNPTVVYTTPTVLAQRPGALFSWTIADLPPHTGGQIRIRATVDPATVPPVVFHNEAEIWALTFDVYPANNVTSVGLGFRYIYLPLALRAYSNP